MAAQHDAPIHAALLAYERRRVVALHTPGHKGRLVARGLEDFLQPLGVACDLPSMEATGNWADDHGPVAEAQALLAELYGAENSYFLLNGSTAGVQAMFLAALRPGDRVLLSRQAHVSVFNALALSGADPVFLRSRHTDVTGALPVDEPDVRQALAADPSLRAVFLTHPSYYGFGRSLAPIARICRERGVLLLVDEAHGAHLRFLPPGNLPSALDEGADLVVQSAHKTLASLVGTAHLHRGRGCRVPRERVRAALKLLGSTSPNHLLLASLDLSRRWLAEEGSERLRAAPLRWERLRERLDAVPGLRTVAADGLPALAGCRGDPLKLVVDVAGLGSSGSEVERLLYERAGILCEFSAARSVVFVLTPGDRPEDDAMLVDAFIQLAGSRPDQPRCGDQWESPVQEFISRPLVRSPRAAFFAPKRQVPTAEAEGAIAGELITVYPPGIPLLAPGERVDAAALQALRAAVASGAYVAASDHSGRTVTVVDETADSASALSR